MFRVKSKRRRQIMKETKERAERMKAMKVITTLILMVFTKMPKRCRVMMMWIRTPKKMCKKSKEEKEEVIHKRKE